MDQHCWCPVEGWLLAATVLEFRPVQWQVLVKAFLSTVFCQTLPHPRMADLAWDNHAKYLNKDCIYYKIAVIISNCIFTNVFAVVSRPHDLLAILAQKYPLNWLRGWGFCKSVRVPRGNTDSSRGPGWWRCYWSREWGGRTLELDWLWIVQYPTHQINKTISIEAQHYQRRFCPRAFIWNVDFASLFFVELRATIQNTEESSRD